jgi:hypothetical protein
MSTMRQSFPSAFFPTSAMNSSTVEQKRTRLCVRSTLKLGPCYSLWPPVLTCLNLAGLKLLIGLERRARAIGA